MKDIAIAIEVGSPNSTINLVSGTFESIRRNIGKCDWKVFIMLGLNIRKDLDQYVTDYVKRYPQNFEIFDRAEISWAVFINKAIELSSDYRFFIKSHDDIELLTNDFYTKLITTLSKLPARLGWISFTDAGWRNGDFSPPTRDGYYIDVRNENSWATRKIFQFHNFPSNWTRASVLIHYGYYGLRRISKWFSLPVLHYPKPSRKIKHYTLDLPKNPVKCHAPFNHFVLIERNVLDMIGPCEDWDTPNALLVDEDWGLRCLEMNIPNIWIPDIEYIHFRGKFEGGGTRSWTAITKEAQRVEQLFFNKWGFHAYPNDEEIELIRKKHANNLIPWSSYRRSWEWDEM